MNVIDRFRKCRKYQIGGQILKFQNSGKAPILSNSDRLFESLYTINSKAHNKNTLSKIYSNIEATYKGLLNYGLSPEEASGIMGNMLAENTNFDPNLSNGKYKGLVQVSPSIQNYIISNYGDFSHNSQLRFIVDWVKGKPYKKDPSNVGYMYDRYSSSGANSPETYADAWSTFFERHGKGSSLRQKYAKMFYDHFKQ